MSDRRPLPGYWYSSQYAYAEPKAVEAMVSGNLFLRRADKMPLQDAGRLCWHTAAVYGRKREYQREATLAEDRRPHVSWAWAEYTRPRRAGRLVGVPRAADGRSAAVVLAMRYEDAGRGGTVQVSRYDAQVAAHSLREYNAWLLGYEYLLRKRKEARDPRRTVEVVHQVLEIQKLVERMTGTSICVNMS